MKSNTACYLLAFGLFVAAFVGGLLPGFSVYLLVIRITGDENLASKIACIIWFFFLFPIMAYGSLFFPSLHSFPTARKPYNLYSVFGMAAFYAFIGGGFTVNLPNVSTIVITVVAMASAVLGGLFAYDINRRQYKIQEQSAAEESKEAPPHED